MFRLDPAATPLWRTPDCLQFGTDPVLAVLPRVSPGTEFLVAALSEGAEREHLDDLADRKKLPPAAVDALLAALEPVLEHPPAPPATTVVDGPLDLVELLTRRLLPLGCTPNRTGVRPDLVLLAAHHVLPPFRRVRWLTLDVPHLPVVFGDQSVQVGPLVDPGRTPCLRCADEHRMDEEPAWPALAAQLLRRPRAQTCASSAVCVTVEACLVAVLRARTTGEPTGLEGAALRVAADGAVSRLERPWHDRCSCRSLAPAA